MALFSQLSIDRGEGAVLYDVDGNSYIDLLAGVGVASLGYAHPRYVAALQRQLARIHVGSFTSEHRAALVKLLAELAPGEVAHRAHRGPGVLGRLPRQDRRGAPGARCELQARARAAHAGRLSLTLRRVRALRLR